LKKLEKYGIEILTFALFAVFIVYILISLNEFEYAAAPKITIENSHS
jgi:hypothetical protein